MLKTPTLGLLLALAALAAALPDSLHPSKDVVFQYRTVEGRLLDGVRLHRGPSYLLAPGQCNVTLTERELCGEGLLVAALQVTVRSAAGYADVAVRLRELGQVQVTLPRCRAAAALDLRLGCLRRKLGRSRSRVPLPQH